jgi:hypothetical protein
MVFMQLPSHLSMNTPQSRAQINALLQCNIAQTNVTSIAIIVLSHTHAGIYVIRVQLVRSDIHMK